LGTNRRDFIIVRNIGQIDRPLLAEHRQSLDGLSSTRSGRSRTMECDVADAQLLMQRGVPFASSTCCTTELPSYTGLMALLEDHGRVAAGYAVGDQRAEVLPLCALVQERIADECDERLEFSSGKTDRLLEERV